MKNPILFILILSFNIHSQDNDKYIMFKPLNWHQLQLYQLDSLDSAEELKLASTCPSTLSKLQSSHELIGTHVQHILGTIYIWSEYTNSDGLKCFVKHDKVDSITLSSSHLANPNEYELLDTIQARVLKSASLGVGLKEKGFYEKTRQLSLHNQRIKNKPYEKYGGMHNVVNYMMKNKATYQLDEEYLKSLTTTKNNIVTTKQIPLYITFELTYTKEQQEELINIAKKKVKSNLLSKQNNVTSSIQRVPNNEIVDGDFNPVFPYGAVGRNLNFFASIPGGGQVGSDVLFTPFITLTAAHVLRLNNKTATNSLSQIGAIPNGSGDYNVFNGYFESEDLRFSSEFNDNSFAFDYGVLRSATPFPYPFSIDIDIVNIYPRTVNVLGYPKDLIGMHKGTSNAEYDPLFPCTNNNGTIHYKMNSMKGMSGGPIFDSANIYTTGIHNYGCDLNGIKYGNGIPFTTNVLNEILSWTWNPSGVIEIQYPEPNIDINLVAIESFEANFNTFSLMNIQGNIEVRGNDFDNLIEWESSNDGFIGQGSIITSDILKNTLTSGVHRITAKIDSNGESGEKNININIIRPSGQFTSVNYCIIDLANSPNNTCPVTIKWTVTDTPETSVVWNETQNSLFASGNTGSKAFNATTSNTVFKLYPSNQRKILLDTANVSAKAPTGNLSNPSPQCSLQPTPMDPHTGQYRDPKATPPGCGTQLSWSNVRWASPSIFYRHVGSRQWVHLYQIGCNLNGEVCTGSINTDDLIPELIKASGTEFKLLQYNDHKSGVLSPAFSVSGHRFADIYEYDNARHFNFDFAANANLPVDFEFNYALTTQAHLNVPQHNHSFHSPAIYDDSVDTDSVQVPIDILGGFNNGQKLKVTAFNIVGGLGINLGVQCAGKKTRHYYHNGEPTKEVTLGVFTFNANPRNSLETDPITGNRIMIFDITPGDSYIQNGENIFLECTYNRIIISRFEGTGIPSENLTYSVVVEELIIEPDPILNTATVQCNNNYCMRLLGENFDANASVEIRENVNGSPVLTNISGNDIHNRAEYQGQDQLFFPIVNLSIQEKFENNGLCFKVINNEANSNEKCVSRPVTAPQPLFVGKTVTRYDDGAQDVQHTSYVVAGNDGNGGGDKLKIMGNSWKKINVGYQVTPNTYLEFDFRSTQQQSEVNGIGFIMKGSTTMAASRLWQVYGTQILGNQSHHNYSGNDWVSYRIPVGESFTGPVKDMVFVADEDAHVSQNIVYRNPRLVEVMTPPDQYDDVPAQRPFDDDVNGQGVLWTGGTIEHIHNFHDAGDIDWTIIYMNGTKTFRTEMIGANSDTKMEVYKWISADLNPNGDGSFINVVDESQGSDNSVGNSSVTVSSTKAETYAVRIESRLGVFGNNTEYKFWIESPPIDQYDDVPAQRPFDDDVNGQGVLWTGGTIEHIHNFHDAGDVDWTIIYMNGTNTFRTEMIGANSDTKMEVYKWISADLNPNGDGSFINVIDESQGSDNSVGNSSVTVSSTTAEIYAVKIESRLGVFGNNTEYKFLIDSTSPDQYDDVPAQRPYDDDLNGQAVAWTGGTTEQLHNFHDHGDVDWVFVYMSGSRTFRTEMIGVNSDTKISVYQWKRAEENPNGDGSFVNVVDELIESDNNVGNSSVTVSSRRAQIFAVKIESRLGDFGPGTEYKLIIE